MIACSQEAEAVLSLAIRVNETAADILATNISIPADLARKWCAHVVHKSRESLSFVHSDLHLFLSSSFLVVVVVVVVVINFQLFLRL